MLALYRNHMGNDLEVVNDARISFAKQASVDIWETITVPDTDAGYNSQVSVPLIGERDRSLIQFLARGCMKGDWDKLVDALDIDHTGVPFSRDDIENILAHVKKIPTHWTPFAQQVVKLRMKAPVPIRTQCFKCKSGFVENEESRRYSCSTPALFIPEFRSAPEGNIKQGSGGIHPDNENLKKQYGMRCRQQIDFYEELIANGVAPEQALFVLPQGVFVNWVWTGSLYAFAEVYNKRADRSHSQGEVADIADAISPIMHTLFPVSWAALTE